MKISIITATYNSEKNITNCLQSVAGQTYQNIEHIVIDGGSTDNTLEIVKNTPSCIQLDFGAIQMHLRCTKQRHPTRHLRLYSFL